MKEIEGVGPIVGESVYAFFHDPASQKFVAGLQAAGVNTRSERPSARSQPLAGRQYVLTGSLSSMTRGEAEARLKQLGAAVGSSVTKKTNSLITGEDPGSKLARATQLGTSVLDEAGFIELVEAAERAAAAQA